MADQHVGGRLSSFDAVIGSYRRLADVFRDLLSEQSLDVLLERIADAVADLIPYDSLIIYQADEAKTVLTPVVARDEKYKDELLDSEALFGEGLTGWAVERKEPILVNEAHLDPRGVNVPGTPAEPEAMISLPLTARGVVKGALNLYRVGEGGTFSEEEFDLAKRFGDVAALAIDNAKIRSALETHSQTDSLTGLFTHRYFHERLRSELNRASRSRDAVSLIVFDLDDFKRVNEVHGHATGDQVLTMLGEILRSTVRGSDIPCRLGGEEFGIILPSCDAGDALGLVRRLSDRLAATDFDPVEELKISGGIAQGPAHGANSRELFKSAEKAMNTAKNKRRGSFVLFDGGDPEGSETTAPPRGDVKSIAHLKMLQSLSGKLNQLNDVGRIGKVIADELRTLIDYHSCRVYLAEDELLFPIASRLEAEAKDHEWERAHSVWRIGEGVTGRVAQTGTPLLIGNLAETDMSSPAGERPDAEESILSVPLSYGVRVIGVVTVSKLGVDQFDEDELRLMEVLAGHASVALENARLYEAQRREAEFAKALWQFADAATKASSFHHIVDETARMATELLDVSQASVWLLDERSGTYHCAAQDGYAGDPEVAHLVRTRIERERGQQLLTGRSGPFVITPGSAERYFETAPGAISRNLAIAPLQRGDGLDGWITVRQPTNKGVHFTEERMRLLAGLASHASVALQKALLYKTQKETAEIANSLLDFSRELAEAEGSIEVLERIAELAARILGSPTTVVWLEDPDSGLVVPQVAWGFHGEDLDGLMAKSLSRDEAKSLLVADKPYSRSARELGKLAWAKGSSGDFPVAVAPLKLDGRLGCIVSTAPALGDYQFSERKMRLLGGIAHQAQLAISNAVTYESMEQTFLDTVEALANALEAKDEYTSSHARWITDTALRVGREVGMEPRELKRLELGALFHDIGKIGIPSDILQKPGPLDDDEWAIIKLHPELGERILAPIARLADVRPIVRACHEHFDGTGYPDRKSGDMIPLESRIILVVDAFHAMTSDRPYRKALPIDEACRRLEENAGTQFDPNVVGAFVDLVRRDPELAASA